MSLPLYAVANPAETPSPAASAPHDLTVFTRVAELSELEPHGQFSKWVGDHDLLVYKHQGGIKVLSNICPHFGGPVGYHKQKDGEFVCLWHNYRFGADDGKCRTVKNLKLREYKAKVEDGGIWVQLVEVP
jgi:nitrite reductase/ring-hydroxylating ferredoxin subunit